MHILDARVSTHNVINMKYVLAEKKGLYTDFNILMYSVCFSWKQWMSYRACTLIYTHRKKPTVMSFVSISTNYM